MEQEAAIFKALSDPTRLRLAVLLAVQGETCVCKLTEALDAPQFKISRHLAVMRAAGIVTARRDGAWMHYKLADAQTKLEACLQECFRECLSDNKTVRADLKRLTKAPCKS